MAFTMADFRREYIQEHLPELTPEEQEDILNKLPLAARLAGLPPEARLAGLTAEQIRNYLEQLTAAHKSPSRKPRRKK